MNSTLNETGYFLGTDKRRLFYQVWKSSEPRGIAVITHGLSENTDRYSRLALYLNQDHWNVYAWDLRGHGRSSGIRGYVKKFRLFERDLVYFTDFILKKEKKLPLVFIGHSLGGLILMRALYNEENMMLTADGICVSAPALALRMSAPLFKLIAGYCSHYLCPWLAFYDKILSTHLSRDPYFQRIIEKDLFRHGKITPEIYFTLLKNPKMMKNTFPMARGRILMQAGGEDMVVSNEKSQVIFERVRTSSIKKSIIYPSSMHQLFEDYGCDRVMEDIKLFIHPLISDGKTLSQEA